MTVEESIAVTIKLPGCVSCSHTKHTRNSNSHVVCDSCLCTFDIIKFLWPGQKIRIAHSVFPSDYMEDVYYKCYTLNSKSKWFNVYCSRYKQPLPMSGLIGDKL